MFITFPLFKTKIKLSFFLTILPDLDAIILDLFCENLSLRKILFRYPFSFLFSTPKFLLDP